MVACCAWQCSSLQCCFREKKNNCKQIRKCDPSRSGLCVPAVDLGSLPSFSSSAILILLEVAVVAAVVVHVYICINRCFSLIIYHATPVRDNKTVLCLRLHLSCTNHVAKPADQNDVQIIEINLIYEEEEKNVIKFNEKKIQHKTKQKSYERYTHVIRM